MTEINSIKDLPNVIEELYNQADKYYDLYVKCRDDSNLAFSEYMKLKTVADELTKLKEMV